MALEIKSLEFNDFDIDVLGFSSDELNDLYAVYDDGNDEDSEDEVYTAKIETPIYEPENEQPKVIELYDETKTKSLIEEIQTANLPKEIEGFLIAAAQRHTVFNFSKIANYYAHANEDIQNLFERSALVIIDFNKAVENGYVKLTEKMIEIVHGGENAQ